MQRPWVWFDLENTPHVLFLEPFVRLVEADGWLVRISAKPQAQTLDLARARGVEANPVGRGGFASLSQKIAGGVSRALSLARWVRRFGRPALLVSSSRSASLAAWLLRVPGVGLLDYEHSEKRTLALNATLWMPDLLRDLTFNGRCGRAARFYSGLKENLYLDKWSVDRRAERRRLGVADHEYVVVARPAADAAHYHRDDSSRMWFAAVRGLAAQPGVRVVVVARDTSQRAKVSASLKTFPTVQVIDGVVQGPALVAAADLVLSGGGTMNREAAVLGVPAWSTFCGPTPAIDDRLAAEKRLQWIRSECELAQALAEPLPTPQERRGPYPGGFKAVAQEIQGRLTDG